MLPRLKSDLAEIFLATVEGRLQEVEIEWSDEAAVCVVLASGGYPGPYEKGKPITGLDQSRLHRVPCRHGAAGRPDRHERRPPARRHRRRARYRGSPGDAYADIEKIRYEGKHYRTDIALKALQAMKG